jgi:hypothetical protein
MGERLGSMSFAGLCPGATLPEYDISYEPGELFAMLRDRGIDLETQPDVFCDGLPPDRSRFVSLPGGCPSPDVLWRRCNERALVEIERGTDLAVEIAQHLMSPQSILVDAGPAVGCTCAGITRSTAGISARVAVTSLEPPRATSPVFTNSANTPLNQAIPPDAPRGVGQSRPPMAVTPSSALKVRR